MNENYIYEIETSEMYFDTEELICDGVFFFGDRMPTLYEVLEKIEKIENTINGEKINKEDFLMKLLMKLNINKNELKKEFDVNYNEKLDINKYYYEIIDYIDINYIDKKEDMYEIINILDYDFDTSGYSPWSYYVAKNDVDSRYINDVYNGYNFYSITQYKVDKDTKEIEYCNSIIGLYIKNTKELIECIKDNFNGDYNGKIIIIDNEDSKYIHIEKIKTYDVTKTFIKDNE